jgi:tetratricopeptide (TPR) repeat protein
MQLQVLEQNEGDEPDDTLAVLIQKYRLYQRYGKDDKAEEIFQQLASRHGETSSVMQLALQRAAAKREWDAAMEWAQKAREAASETRLGQVAPANVRRTQAKAILSGGDVTEEDRDKAYELLLKAASEFETAQRQGVMAKLCFASAADCYLMLAQLRPEQRDAYLQQADEAAGRALEYDADYMPAIEVKLSLAQLRNDTLARDRWLEQAHRINPMNPQIRLRWINLQEKTADRDEILRRRQLLDADTDGAFPSNTLRLAQLYEQTGQADKATETYRRYFNEAPSKIQGFIALGRYLVRSGNAAQAQELYANLLRAASEEDKLRVRLAYADVMRPSDPAFADRIVQQILDSDEYKNEPRLRSLRVQRLAQQGRYDQAITLLRRMLEDNDTPQQRRLLISWLIQARKYDQAIDEIEAMDTESPEAKAWALLRRAGIAQARAATMTGDEAMSELAKAKNLINQAIDANPDDATPLLELARYEQRHGQMFRAIEAAERARQLSDSPGVLQILADLCRQDHQYARAETLYRALLNAQGSRQAYEQLLNYYDSRRNWAKYDQLMAEAVQVFPRSDGLMLAHARSYNRRAHAALRAQRSQQAQQYLQRMSARLEQVLQLSPDNVQAWRLLLSGMLTAGRYEQLLERFEQDIAPRRNLRQELLAYKAAAQGALGREDQAMETFAEAIRNAPVSSLSSAAALVERTLSPREEALSRLRDWVALRENDPHWLAIVAGKHMAGPGADMDYARQLYQRALGRIESGDPLSGEIHGQLGMIWYRNKDYQKAEKAYLRAIESGSVSAGLLNNLAYMYAEDMNQPEKALPYARRAAQIAGQNPSILDTYAWALVRSGHIRDARQPMEQAIQAADNPAPLLRYHMGFVYEKLKQYAQAQRQYRLALEDARIEDDASLKQKATEGMHRIEELTQSPNGES